MSGLFGSTLIKGTRITEFSETTATVGNVIPFGYGRFTSGGNVVWAPLPPKEHRHVKRQGKGGVKQESFTYTLSYAIAFAKGPIYGYWWIKRNGKVVWTQDPAAPIEDQEYAAKWAQRATFYYGTMDQLPDSTIESYEGTGQVSAFHRLAYIVVEDDDVTEGGGAVPTYEACVIAAAPNVYLTSHPYNLAPIESIGVEGAYNSITTFMPPMDGLNVTAEVGVEVIQVVNYLTYNHPAPEEVNASASLTSLDVTVVVGYKTYNHPAPENVDASASLQSVSLVSVVISYTNYAPESVDVSASLQGVTLS